MRQSREIPQVIKKLPSQILFFIGIPVFFLAFVLIYDPLGSQELIDAGRGLFSFNITMLTCIALTCLVGCRVAFHYVWRRRHMRWTWYVEWCIAETLIISLFFSLYIYLMFKGQRAYFPVLGDCIRFTFLVLIFPYALISMGLTIVGLKEEALEDNREESLMRFPDYSQRIKLVIAPAAILYIAAQENYIRVFYLDAGRVKDYVLRNSMKALEEPLVKHGLQRCHRSYFVNPKHIKVLRKDAEGQILAELDSPEPLEVPVSKRYHEAISSLL